MYVRPCVPCVPCCPRHLPVSFYRYEAPFDPYRYSQMAPRRRRLSGEPPPHAAADQPPPEEIFNGRASSGAVVLAAKKAAKPMTLLLSVSFAALAFALTITILYGETHQTGDGHQQFLTAMRQPTWPSIMGVLLSVAILSLGVDNLHGLTNDLLLWLAPTAPRALSWLHIPLTDAELSVGTINKFANSCQVREKSLKILQYLLKGTSYLKLFDKGTSAQLNALSKSTSIARRYFKFCRWVKHFDDLKEAKNESNSILRALLYLRVAANLGADWAEDVCSLERIGFLPKGTLSVEFMLFAEYCQLALALIEIGIANALVRAQQEASDQAAASKAAKEQRKLALLRLELVKFVSDVGKAIYDCELEFSHEGVFIGCALFSALISTHKNMVKVLK